MSDNAKPYIGPLSFKGAKRVLGLLGQDELGTLADIMRGVIRARAEAVDEAEGDEPPDTAKAIVTALADEADSVLKLAVRLPDAAQALAESCLYIEGKPVQPGHLDDSSAVDVTNLLSEIVEKGVLREVADSLKNALGAGLEKTPTGAK